LKFNKPQKNIKTQLASMLGFVLGLIVLLLFELTNPIVLVLGDGI